MPLTLQHGHLAQHAHEPLLVLAAGHLLERVVAEIDAADLVPHEIDRAVPARAQSLVLREEAAVVARVHQVRQSRGLFRGARYIWRARNRLRDAVERGKVVAIHPGLICGLTKRRLAASCVIIRRQ